MDRQAKIVRKGREWVDTGITRWITSKSVEFAQVQYFKVIIELDFKDKQDKQKQFHKALQPKKFAKKT